MAQEISASPSNLNSSRPSDSLESTAMRKIRRRLLPFVFILYVVAFLDRANVAYAKLEMSKQLGFSEAVYGFGAGRSLLGICCWRSQEA